MAEMPKIESIVHVAVREMLQRIWNEHGLRVQSVHAAWLSRPFMQTCMAVEIKMTTFHDEFDKAILARCGVHSADQPLTPYGVQVIDDLAGLVRRLRYQLKKHDPNSTLVAQAYDYLKRSDMQGNPLRSDEE